MSGDHRGYQDLNVYSVAYQLALEIHEGTKRYPKEEKYSLIDQIRRSSRSIPANLAEAWKKRRYEKAFVSKLIDCAGEAGETEVWLGFSRGFGYIEDAQYQRFIQKYDEVNRMLYGMIEKADKFCH
ncbi:MAG: four helix bundle protein [Deltaproteobacteria bacterium]|nr:four helix bundle protein [Deltaproteobacteria bacterium]MBW2111948.1 four helix bundle protein [Deltaproteobacteria bacterium]MBW2353483.1 four helix bundle protein [Deltaproteobacteria bacterium]HDZ91817.1 four helix bundle protein [Deltaproteobacteria bacterium]